MRERIAVGFLATASSPAALAREERCAWEWLGRSRAARAVLIPLGDLARGGRLRAGVRVLWWHEGEPGKTGLEGPCTEALLEHVERGGGVLLSLAAAMRAASLGLGEPGPLAVPAPASPEGDTWGYQGYGGPGSGGEGHPIFRRFGGGIYTSRPAAGEPRVAWGWEGRRWPASGRVIGVEKGYIAVRAGRRIAVEWWRGKGKILVAGAHLRFGARSPRFRPHLEAFLEEILAYLAAPGRYSGSCWRTRRSGVIWRAPGGVWRPHAWTGSPSQSRRGLSGRGPSARGEAAPERPPGSELRRPGPAGLFTDVTGRRILALGREDGRVDEIWAYPLRVARGLLWGVRSRSQGPIRWAGTCARSFARLPWGVGVDWGVADREGRLEIAADPERPGLVASLRLPRGEGAVPVARLQPDLRMMWPLPRDYLGASICEWDAQAGALRVSDEGNRHVALVGFAGGGRARREGRQGVLMEGGVDGCGEAHFIVAGGRGMAEALRTYRRLASEPGACRDRAAARARRVLSRGTTVEAPDSEFVEGFRWAALGLDSFVATAPGMGTSLLAGFQRTGRGWLQARPGYAWFFGRDAVWTALALLPLGAFETSREVLAFLARHQDVAGKILHEASCAGPVHYDAADSTPLFLFLLAEHLRWTGDLAFVRELWPAALKALRFAISTDRDGDGFIENTEVGHGWVEGGPLAGAHVTTDLASVWGSALEGMAFLAQAVGDRRLARGCRSRTHRVRAALQGRLWNEKRGWCHYGLDRRGRPLPDRTLLAAVPLLLGHLLPDQEGRVLEGLASADFTADWGARILPRSDPRYDPRGYHAGSVWPLFTGWASLAAYRGHRPAPAFSLLMANLLLYRAGPLGMIPEVLHGDQFEEAGVCPHQAWSHAMVLAPALRGLWGLAADAPRGHLLIAPHIPPGWRRCALRGVRVGGTRLDVEFERREGSWLFRLEPRGPGHLEILLSPGLPAGSAVEGVRLSGSSRRAMERSVDWAQRVTGEDLHLDIPLRLEDAAEVEIRLRPGPAVEPPIWRPSPGAPSEGLRVLREAASPEAYALAVEGLAGREYELALWAPSYIRRVRGASLLSEGKGRHRLAVSFPRGEGYQRREIAIAFEGSQAE